MASFTKDPTARTPFGGNEYLRSTQDVKTESYTVAASSVPESTVDGDVQKVLQPGTVMARITSGAESGKIGPFQAAGADEVQTLTATGTWSAGTYTLTVLGATTDAIAIGANAATIQTEIRDAVAAADPDYDVTTITVTGGPLSTTPVVVTFNGAVGVNVPAITWDISLVTGSTPGLGVAETTPGAAGATDGRQTAANIVGILDTFLPWTLLNRDVEVAVVYEATVVQAWCFEYNDAGSPIALSNTTRDAMLALPGLALLFK